MKTKDACEDFSKDKERVDFTNYSLKSKHYDDKDKIVIGMMKDRTAGVTAVEFVGLRPKMYSFLVDDSSEDKKAKGVNKNIAQQ